MAREMLQNYRKVVEEYCSVARGLKEEDLELGLAPGKWTVWEHLVHVVDVELVVSFRLRKMIAEDKPLLLVFDQDAWVDKLDYTGLNPDQLADVLQGFLIVNGALLANFHPIQYERVGVHEQKGKVATRDIVAHQIGHIEHHVEIIKRILEKAANKSKLASKAQ